MSKRKQLSPLVIPIVAIVLTLVLAGIVLVYAATRPVREVPIPGPTVTVSVDANLNPPKTL